MSATMTERRPSLGRSLDAAFQDGLIAVRGLRASSRSRGVIGLDPEHVATRLSTEVDNSDLFSIRRGEEISRLPGTPVSRCVLAELLSTTFSSNMDLLMSGATVVILDGDVRPSRWGKRRSFSGSTYRPPRAAILRSASNCHSVMCPPPLTADAAEACGVEAICERSSHDLEKRPEMLQFPATENGEPFPTGATPISDDRCRSFWSLQGLFDCRVVFLR